VHAYLGARSLTGSTGCINKLECLLDFNFCKAVRHALRSKDAIPPLCAFGTAFASLFFAFNLNFVTAGVLDEDPCLVRAGCPVTGEDVPAASACAADTRRIFGVTGVDTGVFLGPPDLMDRDGLGGTGILTRGRGGAVSVTGVEGGK
jgi:hypothetical protein